jgi:hypothetical protein
MVATISNEPKLLSFKNKTKLLEYIFEKTLAEFWNKDSHWIDHIFVGKKVVKLGDL